MIHFEELWCRFRVKMWLSSSLGLDPGTCVRGYRCLERRLGRISVCAWEATCSRWCMADAEPTIYNHLSRFTASQRVDLSPPSACWTNRGQVSGIMSLVPRPTTTRSEAQLQPWENLRKSPYPMRWDNSLTAFLLAWRNCFNALKSVYVGSMHWSQYMLGRKSNRSRDKGCCFRFVPKRNTMYMDCVSTKYRNIQAIIYWKGPVCKKCALALVWWE